MFAPRPLLLAVVAALAAAAAACASNAAKSDAPAASTLPFVPAVSANAAAARASREAAEPDEPDPSAERLLRERLEQPAVALAQIGTPPRVPKIALDNSALDHAQGMQADADHFTAKLSQGQRASMLVTVAPGECTTFVAQGGLGVAEVDLFLTTGAGDAVRVLALDPLSGPIAALGGKGRCFQNAQGTPLAGELHLIVRRGDGAVLVRRYRRAPAER